MNTYNDNLRDSVVKSLNTIETEIKNTKAKKDASMFSLYFAEGAKITALDKFNIEKTKYVTQSGISIEAVTNENIAINLLDTATQEKDLVAQSVTNTAVAAANVQVAANSVLKLASDVGSILSIVLAADYNTEISKLTKYTNSVMNDTAYSAELASQIAMETAAMTALVSASTVEEQATVTLASITTLTEQLAANVDATNTKMIADGAALDAASLVEKKAEGTLEDMTVEYSAIVNAYNKNRKNLNLDLQVAVSSIESLMKPIPLIDLGKVKQSGKKLKNGTDQVIKGLVKDEKGKALAGANVEVVGDKVGTVTDSYGHFELTIKETPLILKISYEGYVSFEFKVERVNLKIELAPSVNVPLSDHQFEVYFEPYSSPFPYPKKPLKDKKAENVVTTQTNLPGTGYPVESYFIYIVENSMKSTFSLSYAESLVEHDPNAKQVQHISAQDCSIKTVDNKKFITHVFDQHTTYDVEGKRIEFGKEYVVFVMAVLDTKYKKLVNDFEDFLSAPSSPFMLTNKLLPVDPETFMVEKIKDKENRVFHTYFSFLVKKSKTDPNEEYRCIFLPKGEAATNGLLNMEELAEMQSEIMSGGEISKLYDPAIAKLESKLGSLKSYKDAFENEKELFVKENKDIEKAELEKLIDDISKRYPSEMHSYEDYEKELKSLYDSKKSDVELASKKCVPVIDFIFNKLIAEQVASGNYYKAKPTDPQPTTKDGFTQMRCEIKIETTDNFGNRIIANSDYIPVVLSYANAKAENIKQFENALSDYMCTTPQVLIGDKVLIKVADAKNN